MNSKQRRTDRRALKSLWIGKGKPVTLTPFHAWDMIRVMEIQARQNPKEYIFMCAASSMEVYKKALGENYNGKPIRYVTPPKF